MYLYIKATYQSWCQGQTNNEARARYKEFIRIVSRMYALSEADVYKHLERADWFLRPAEELL